MLNVSLFLAQQNLAFRSNIELVGKQELKGRNFLYLIGLHVNYDTVLKELIEKLEVEVKYLS